MSAVQITTDPDRTVAVLGETLLAQLQTRGRAKSHVETVESHLRVHIVPSFGSRPVDRIEEADVTRFLARLRRSGLAPKTVRNVASTLHSLFGLAMRRRGTSRTQVRSWTFRRPSRTQDIRFLTQEELVAVLELGVPTGRLQLLDRALYLTGAMTGVRQGELLAPAVSWRPVHRLAWSGGSEADRAAVRCC
jgi:integrase